MVGDRKNSYLLTLNKNMAITPATQPKPAAALVVGGGIGGMRAALDLANAGLKVHLIEHTPCLGGRVAQLGFMFPQHDCVLCRGTLRFHQRMCNITSIPILRS
jgi:heterodisulfide reductase subunit A-like polyferredoxin